MLESCARLIFSIVDKDKHKMPSDSNQSHMAYNSSWCEVSELIHLTLEIIITAAHVSSDSDGTSGSNRGRSNSVFLFLIQSLTRSGVLEHAARAVLQLVMGGSAAREPFLGVLRVAKSSCIADLCDATMTLYDASRGTPSAAAAVDSLLRQPCLRHLTASQGITTLAAADGGCAYFLPDELRAQLPVLGLNMRREARILAEPMEVAASGRSMVLSLPLAVLLTQLREGGALRHGTPPLAGSLSVGGALMRLVDWGNESASPSQPAPSQHVGAPPPAPPPQRSSQLLLPPTDAVRIAAQALDIAKGMTGSGRRRRGTGSSDGAGGVRRLSGAGAAGVLGPSAGGRDGLRGALRPRWWPAAVRMMVAASQAGQLDAVMDEAGFILFFRQETLQVPLTATAPPEVVAALAAGLLPCLELLMRRAVTQDPSEPIKGAGPTLALRALGRGSRDESQPWAVLGRYLAYAQPSQAAAFAATLAKFLHRLRLELASCCSIPLSQGVLEAAKVVGGFLAGAQAAGPWAAHPDGTVAGCATGPSPPGPSPSTASPTAASRAAALPAVASSSAQDPSQQLWLCVAYGVCRWLPPLAQGLTLHATETFLRYSLPPGHVIAPLSAVLRWIPAAVLAATAGGAAAAAWRAWLLRDLCVLPFLGAALELSAGAGSDELQRLLARACLAAAGALPAELRAQAAEARARVASGGDVTALGGGEGLDALAEAFLGRRGRGGDDRASVLRALVLGQRRAAASGPVLGPPWDPAALRALCGCGGGVYGGRLEALAAEMEGRGGAGGGVAAWGSCGSGAAAATENDAAALAQSAEAEAGARDAALAQRLVPPTELPALLPPDSLCCNPACDNLAGGSEADLPLQRCGRCKAAWYCSRECQSAHWGAGHKEKCRQVA